MSYLVPPEGASDEEIERFIASLRNEARGTVREMLANGASEDEIVDYINSLDSDTNRAAIDTSESP
ncbi:MAG TPA: hypothetical protein VGA47_10890 [Candidatus Dormibacteraeota bacterium]|jgi:hypothetical protein